MTVTADLGKLESVAQQLIGRIHEDDPKLVWAWLARELPEPADWYRLVHVLACAVPTDRTWGELTAWARGTVGFTHPQDSDLRPQGTSTDIHRPSTRLSTGARAARLQPG